MLYRNFLWDFDGTLFDSYLHVMRCCWDALEDAGLAASLDWDMTYRCLLKSFATMKRYTGMPDDVYAAFVARSHLVGDAEVLPRAVPFDDAKDVLAAVVKRGGRNYLYTHRNETARWYLETYGLADLFADLLMAEEGFPAKPAPDAVLALIGRNGLDPAECVMVGDREIDGLAGKNAGIAGALVNYPPCLPDGTSPAAVTRMDYTAASLTDFARQMGIF